ncbi:1-acyl-sn-glycerol-3-phosphate acyltransferase [Silvanigrella aquatica]|uniref:Uncharacterized protein n=1 Tax=Silvanigrella aquatica TaxID=1915309 RepID=A0A1L4CXB9_9BACT|nr:1-acyl-sn-glycerol-3-phosphate acyltransferase [Silvanigrella aquatica]APJ02589.1 hypothetical protein AXG55_01025 [Silvanigrella aquatica]
MNFILFLYKIILIFQTVISYFIISILVKIIFKNKFILLIFKLNSKEEIKNISNILISGFNVIIFPEATTSDGSMLLDFKRPLFNSAINSCFTPILNI